MDKQRGSRFVAVRPGIAIDVRQQIPYFVGISTTTAGAKRFLEAACYDPAGLREVIVSEPGEFLYIAANVPHLALNLSETEPAMALVARTDANEQEHVIPCDPAEDPQA